MTLIIGIGFAVLTLLWASVLGHWLDSDVKYPGWIAVPCVLVASMCALGCVGAACFYITKGVGG